MTEISFRGRTVSVTCSAHCEASDALNTDLVRDWLASLDSSLDLRSIEIQSVDYFGSGRIGFVKLKTVILRCGTPIPGIVLLRGSAVGVLIHLTDEDTGNEYTILAEQPRVPVGCLTLEIPAGMTDGSGNLRGVAIRELEEECGLHAAPEDLIDMTEIAYGGRFPGVYSSMGLLDESLRLFLWRLSLPHARIAEIEGRLGGEDEHEQITLRLVPFAGAWRQFPDSKLIASVFLYEQLKAEGKI